MVRRVPRPLVVGERRFLWSVTHRCRDCREQVRFRCEGAHGHVVIVFRAGEGRFVADGLLHAGGLLHADGRYLNLHEPGVGLLLLDEAIARGWEPGGTAHAEMDGWELFDAVTSRRGVHSTAERPPDR